MNIYRGFFQFYLILLNIYKGKSVSIVWWIQFNIQFKMYFHMLGHLLASLDFKMPLFFTFVCLLYVSFHYIIIIIMCYIYIALFWVLKALYIDGGISSTITSEYFWIWVNISVRTLTYICSLKALWNLDKHINTLTSFSRLLYNVTDLVLYESWMNVEWSCLKEEQVKWAGELKNLAHMLSLTPLSLRRLCLALI